MATVMLDAGHGGFDNGAKYNGRREKDDNLNLTLAVGNILENNGIDVLYTRTTDIYQSPNEKARIANESDADYFVSFHRNSSEMPNTYSGVQTLVYEDAGIPAVLAENINNELEKVGFVNLGTEVRKNLAVLRGTNMPAVLVETGFINTDQDNNIFDLKFPEIAQAIAKGIFDTVSGAARMDMYSQEFTVEIGLFSHYDNAKLLAENLQEDGYDCYIIPENKYYGVCHGRFDTYEEAKEARDKVYASGYEARITVHPQ